jgi:hypothetical protein
MNNAAQISLWRFVDAEDALTPLEQRLRREKADEPGSAGEDEAHFCELRRFSNFSFSKLDIANREGILR